MFVYIYHISILSIYYNYIEMYHMYVNCHVSKKLDFLPTTSAKGIKKKGDNLKKLKL
jgi:hypothetical protein